MLNQEVLSRLDALAAKLETTGAHLWAVAVAGQRVEGIVDLVWCVLLVGLAVLLVKFGTKHINDDSDELSFASVGAGIGAILSGILVIVAGPSALYRIFAPEYMALKMLVGK